MVMSKWREMRLEEITTNIYSGGTPSTTNDNYWNGKYYWLSSGETKNRYLFRTDKTITEEGVKNSSTRLAKCDDIVMACAGQGGTRGQTSLVKSDMYINQSVIAIRVDKDTLIPEYLFYNLTNRYKELRLISDASSTRGSITTEMIKSIRIKFPSLPTQQKIADILYAYDDLIENNRRRIKLLEKAAEEIYKEWFVRMRFPNYKKVRFNNGIPGNWTIESLGNITQIVDGDRGNNYPKQHEFSNDGYCLFLNTGNVTKDGFDFSTNNFISKEKDLLLRKGKLQRNDILITTRGTVGNLAFYSKFIPFDNIRINSGMVIIRENSRKINSVFLYHLLKSEAVKKTIELYSSGSAQPQLPIKDMSKIKVILPDDNLIKVFTAKIGKFELLMSNLKTQNYNLIKQRDLLLPRLMSGKLEV
ncbi:MAG: hypothetical protein GX660_18975 [Clostridiaceae bacterium]|nr:hypothetical protein [Clostridiaceae bacterium]